MRDRQSHVDLQESKADILDVDEVDIAGICAALAAEGIRLALLIDGKEGQDIDVLAAIAGKEAAAEEITEDATTGAGAGGLAALDCVAVAASLLSLRAGLAAGTDLQWRSDRDHGEGENSDDLLSEHLEGWLVDLKGWKS